MIRLGQVKIIASEDVIDRFKRIVLAKHGKLELSAEGEEALRLYVRKYEHLLRGMVPPEEDPLDGLLGIGMSAERRSVLEDLERLEADGL